VRDTISWAALAWIRQVFRMDLLAQSRRFLDGVFACGRNIAKLCRKARKDQLLEHYASQRLFFRLGKRLCNTARGPDAGVRPTDFDRRRKHWDWSLSRDPNLVWRQHSPHGCNQTCLTVRLGNEQRA
jgi:hypothetical protein